MSDEKINYQELFNQMPVIRFVINLIGDDFYVLEANEAALKFFNRPKDKVLSLPLNQILTKGNYNLISESLKVSFKKKLPVTIPTLPDFLGEIGPTGLWINPIFDKSNNVIWLDVNGQPNTNNVSIIERERDDALSLLTAIFDASEVGILVFDRNRRIIKTNDSFERIYGWDRQTSIGKDFVDFVTEDEKERATLSYDGFLLNNSSHSGEVKIVCKNGIVANTLYNTSPLNLSHGRRFQVTTLVDITKRKQMELSLRVAKEQADAANNAKSAFLANMSHELRTPLNAIIGFSEMMMNEAFGPLGNSKYNEYLSDVFLSAKHLLEIINEVLDMSKIEAGKIELDEQDVDLNTLIQTLVRIMNSRILNTKIIIKETYQEDLPKLYADPRLLRQILINLITNSIKYSIYGGTISIQTALNNKNEIEVTVSDQGVGIPKDRIKDAMEPFGQIHDPSTHSDVYQGTGLGLPLAKAMVEMHGGDFKLDSEEGKGTTIIMSFTSRRTRLH